MIYKIAASEFLHQWRGKYRII